MKRVSQFTSTATRYAAVVSTLVLDFAFPQRCIACGESLGGTRSSFIDTNDSADADEHLCAACWGEICIRPAARCRRCSRPQRQMTLVCGSCETWDPAFERVLVMTPYEGPIQSAIHALKFQHQRRLGTELGRRLARLPECRYLRRSLDILIPVPLHPARERERGYNQSLFIARGVAEVLDRPIDDCSLKRLVQTRQQAKLDANFRRENLRDAFKVRGDNLSGCKVGLIDDVLTTGATLDACSRALRQAGCSHVVAMAVASSYKRETEERPGRSC